MAAISQFCERAGPEHWKNLAKILMYLSSMKSLGFQLTTYTDTSWTNSDSLRFMNSDGQKSWSGYSIFLKCLLIEWRVMKQSCVVFSSMETELISAYESSKELKFISSWVSLLQQSLYFYSSKIIIQKPILLCDNTTAIHLIKNKADNVRTFIMNFLK